jgi:predicted 3-demethylubiquinone-9 3-methyltransferase (glyoxalase superfamily)
MSKISPCLWFDGQAEEAAAFYVSLFPNSRVDKVSRAPADRSGDAVLATAIFPGDEEASVRKPIL